MYANEQLARARYQEDLARADRQRLVRALRAHRRATRRHARADRQLAQATLRVASVPA